MVEAGYCGRGELSWELFGIGREDEETESDALREEREESEAIESRDITGHEEEILRGEIGIEFGHERKDGSETGTRGDGATIGSEDITGETGEFGKGKSPKYKGYTIAELSAPG